MSDTTPSSKENTSYGDAFVYTVALVLVAIILEKVAAIDTSDSMLVFILFYVMLVRAEQYYKRRKDTRHDQGRE